MNHPPAVTPFAPRWLHWWAVLTVAATTVLLAIGGVVTTFRVGMADPIWPTYPWHLLLISWEEPSPGFLIEHTHRLAGYVVGCCVIVLALGCWLTATRRWLKWLGVTALMAVIAQGLLGGFRVKLNALVGTDLAAVHGCFAQVVFSVLVSVALLTSRKAAGPGLTGAEGRRYQRLAHLLVGLVFVQLVWGALVRHTGNSAAARVHMLTAFAVVAAAAWLARAVLENDAARRLFKGALVVLGALLVLQLMLGVEAWMGKYGKGPLAEMSQITAGQGFVRTAHALVGAGILAASVVIALLAHLPALAATGVVATASFFRPATGVTAVPGGGVRQLEGTA